MESNETALARLVDRQMDVIDRQRKTIARLVAACEAALAAPIHPEDAEDWAPVLRAALEEVRRPCAD